MEGEMVKYYHAYEERYKKIHSLGLSWFSRKPTPELLEWIKANQIDSSEDICEVGCGEGRDALYLAGQGYHISALDVSKSAVEKCKELALKKGLEVNFAVVDILSPGNSIDKKFKWIYSIATLHMLIEDQDRMSFLIALHGMLQPGGQLLLVNMGDGIKERRTDISDAFALQERIHGETGRKLRVAGTTNRVVNWEKHKQEIKEAGFHILKASFTENDEYGKCMTVYLKK